MNNKLEEVAFYHCTSTPILKVVPSLLAKIYETKRNVLVLCDEKNTLEELDQYLWSFSTKVFIPHGTTEEKKAEWQPILLSTDLVDYNKPEILLSFVDVDLSTVKDFKMVIFIFFGNDSDALVEIMQKKNLELRKKEYKVKFWQQDFTTTKWLLAS